MFIRDFTAVSDDGEVAGPSSKGTSLFSGVSCNALFAEISCNFVFSAQRDTARCMADFNFMVSLFAVKVQA